MSNTLRVGDVVFANRTTNVPVRYHGRSGRVVERVRAGRGYRYAIDFNPRRATPLVLGARDLTPA